MNIFFCFIFLILGGCTLITPIVSNVTNFAYSADNVNWTADNCETYCANADSTAKNLNKISTCNEDCSDVLYYDIQLANDINYSSVGYISPMINNQ